MFPSHTRFLIVDDMKTMRRLLAKHLTDLGYSKIVEAEDGEQAWQKIEQGPKAGEPIEVVISDWNMPKLQGIDLLRRIRKSASVRSLPFLMVTAEVEQTSINEASASDTRADGFLSKPFAVEQLREELQRAFAKSQKKAA